MVGASASGLSTVESLRRQGHQGRITVLGAESHLPYDRPPLSKQVLSGSWEPERTQLRPASVLSGLDAEFVLGTPAVGLDVTIRSVHTAAGRSLNADTVVIATGVRPRGLPGAEVLDGVHVLRTIGDTLALRADLLTSTRLVVVGDGVLGAEIAATARTLGLDVTMIGPQQAPMATQLGPLVGGLLGELHDEHGLHVRSGVGVTRLVGNRGRVVGVRLDTGEELTADIVVVAIGGVPATNWLTGSGLHVDNGVVCDSRCRAADGIYAVGDVARWHDEHLDALVRLENRTNATEQATVVAANILGADQPYTPIPYFWTDQYDVRIQVHGSIPTGARMDIVDGDIAAGRFTARYTVDGRTVGIVGWRMPKQTRLLRQEIVDGRAVHVAAE